MLGLSNFKAVHIGYVVEKGDINMKERIYYLKQKLCGLIFVIIGVITPIICDGDATVSLLLIPLGLYLIFTKNKIMYF